MAIPIASWSWRHRQVGSGDLNGFDPLVHGGSPETLLRKVRDALYSPHHRPSHGALLSVYRRVKQAVYADLRVSGAEFFSRATFLDILTVTTSECRAAGLL